MDQNILKHANDWATHPYFLNQDRQEILKLLENPKLNQDELTERFYRDLEFGTGGLRAPMGVGRNRMNRYNVRRAAQALANRVKASFGGGSAVISYDSRHYSKEFAQEVASVFAANKMKAFIFSQLTPTPMLSFAIRYYKAQCGVMITASHNPPIYNGFKAFWNDGAQVVPPTDKEIIQEYNSLTDWEKVLSIHFDQGIQDGLIEWTHENVDSAFYDVIKNHVIQDLNLCQTEGKNLSIIYTALHGSAQVPCANICNQLGFNQFYSIPSQSQPDGQFSTVKSPNPEDPKALALAINHMLSENGDIAFGTDPDGDRLGVVINDHGQAAILNGNQIGAIMLYYLLLRKKEKQAIPEFSYIVKSIVTSPLQNAIAQYFGCKVYDTLTGFKWMAGLIHDLEINKNHEKFIFASEESFGYMPHKESRDKDGVSSLALCSEAALYFKLKGKNLVEVLDQIYDQFGFYYESLVSMDYEGIEGAKKINRIMDFFRNLENPFIAGEEIEIKNDFETSLTTNLKDSTKIIIDLPKSNVLGFEFKSGNRLFLRPSGTEPKIKFYTMVRQNDGDLKHKKDQAIKRVVEIETYIKQCCENI